MCTGLVSGGQAVFLHEESDVLHIVLVQHPTELDHLHTTKNKITHKLFRRLLYSILLHIPKESLCMYVCKCMYGVDLVGVVDLSVELGDFLLVHEEEIGLVVVALDGCRGVRILHLLALHLRA